jgi:hypothetical protein
MLSSTDLGQPQSMDKKRLEGAAAACGSVVGSSSSTGTLVEILCAVKLHGVEKM